MPFYGRKAPAATWAGENPTAWVTGLGLVMGAKLAKPEKVCINFMGDAAFGMTGLDFETASRCGYDYYRSAEQFNDGRGNGSMATSHALYGTRDLGRELR